MLFDNVLTCSITLNHRIQSRGSLPLTGEETRAMKLSKVSREDGGAQAGGSSLLFQHTGGLRQEDAKAQSETLSQRPRRM